MAREGRRVAVEEAYEGGLSCPNGAGAGFSVFRGLVRRLLPCNSMTSFGVS